MDSGSPPSTCRIQVWWLRPCRAGRERFVVLRQLLGIRLHDVRNAAFRYVDGILPLMRRASRVGPLGAPRALPLAGRDFPSGPGGVQDDRDLARPRERLIRIMGEISDITGQHTNIIEKLINEELGTGDVQEEHEGLIQQAVVLALSWYYDLFRTDSDPPS
jgi:hypothetical protein